MVAEYVSGIWRCSVRLAGPLLITTRAPTGDGAHCARCGHNGTGPRKPVDEP